MSNPDASSPQVQAAKKLFDLVTAFDLDNLETVFSKNYQYEAFNGVTDSLAKMDRESHSEMVRVVWAGLTKFDVSIQQRRTIFYLTD